MAKDVTEADFAQAVLARSHELPVVVDFWAEWCGPCRTLTPALEQAAAARAGKIELVKVDTDANRELSRQYEIQGIPAVKAFRDGEVVAEFVGAQSGPVIERFLDGLYPSEADLLVEKGDEESLRKALGLEPGRADASVALGRILLSRGETQQALDVLREATGDFAAAGLAARAELAMTDAADRPPALEAALTALAGDRYDEALPALAQLLGDADEQLRDKIRHIMVGIFAELGADHELSKRYRRELAAALY